MMISESRPKREPVLIVTHGDGHLEVFAGKHVQIKIAAMPYLGEPYPPPLAEDYLERSLPPYWRKLFLPSMVRAAASTKPLTPSKIREANGVDELLRTLDSFQPATQELGAA